jgi:hypothetical protein
MMVLIVQKKQGAGQRLSDEMGKHNHESRVQPVIQTAASRD